MPASWGYWTPIEISMKTQQETQSYNTKTCEHRSRICKVPEETVVSQNCYSSEIVEVKFTQSCPTLCDPVDYTVHGILQARILQWVAVPSPGYLPNPGIEPRSPTLRANSLPAEPQGKPPPCLFEVFSITRSHKVPSSPGCYFVDPKSKILKTEPRE